MLQDEMWEQLLQKDAVTHCKTCGKKIWKFWYVEKPNIFPEMDQCGPCFFKNGKQTDNNG